MINPFARALIPFSRSEARAWPAREMYCPHPFTNWGLNPNYAPHGEKLHTIEGFRKTAPCQSLLDWLADQGAAPVYYALGQSSTYCTELPGLGQAWPDKLGPALVGRGAAKPAVVNGAVGGHSTYQSLIRFMAWGPLIKPDVTLVYTCKNDLTPLKVSDLQEDRVYPDYQNLIAQYGWALLRSLDWRRPNIGQVFKRDRAAASAQDDGGLDRFDDAMLAGVLARYDAIADMAAHWGGQVVFIPEIILPSPYRAPMDRINDALGQVVARHANAVLCDLRPRMPQDKVHFADKLHFTEQGCSVFADVLAEFLHAAGLGQGA